MDLPRLPNGNVIDDQNAETRMTNDERMCRRFRDFRILLGILTIVPPLTIGSVKAGRPTQLSGYKAVRVYYGPLNKMIMPVQINGQPANLLVDTGANHVMLDADAATSFG